MTGIKGVVFFMSRDKEEDSHKISTFQFTNPYTNQEQTIEFYVSYAPSVISPAWHVKRNGINYIVINAAKEGWLDSDLSWAYSTLLHEATHVIDPKTELMQPYSPENPDDTDQYFRYFSQPAEFDAFTTQFAEDIENKYNTTPKEAKQELVDFLLTKLRQFDIMGFLSRIGLLPKRLKIERLLANPILAKRFVQRMFSTVQGLKTEVV